MKQKQKKATIEELTISNMYAIESIMRLLERKKLVTEKEVLDEIKNIRVEQHKKSSNN